MGSMACSVWNIKQLGAWWGGEHGERERRISARTSCGEAFVESADSSGNIRVYSHEMVGLYCTLKAGVESSSARQASSHLRTLLFRSGCSIERAASQGEIALYILLAARESAARGLDHAITRFFARPRLKPIQRKTPACRLAALNAIHSAFCRIRRDTYPRSICRICISARARADIRSMVNDGLVYRPLMSISAAAD